VVVVPLTPVSILIETDSRRRVSLARLGVEADTYYLAERRSDGSIVLVPAEVRPKVLDVVDRLAPDWRESVADPTPPQPSEVWEQIRGEAI